MLHTLPEDVSQARLEKAVAALNADMRVDGLLIQLPLPPHLCEEAVMEHIDPRKDVDGFHPLNMGCDCYNHLPLHALLYTVRACPTVFICCFNSCDHAYVYCVAGGC